MRGCQLINVAVGGYVCSGSSVFLQILTQNAQLRCPIINAKYRQPKSTPLEPISYAELVESAAFQAISTDQPPPSSETSTITGPRSVDFGVWDVDEIQICKIATEGPEGENVSCGGIKI